MVITKREDVTKQGVRKILIFSALLSAYSNKYVTLLLQCIYFGKDQFFY